MYRKIILGFLALSLALLTACGSTEPEESTAPNEIPGRMVQRIDIAIHPADDALARTYTDITQMSAILNMLRDMDTNNVPEEEPDLHGGQSYYTVTATYANGNSRIYYLLGHQFLCCDDGPWCQVDSGKVMELIQYIRENPDDGSAPTDETQSSDETTPTETLSGETVPTESTGETTASEETVSE